MNIHANSPGGFVRRGPEQRNGPHFSKFQIIEGLERDETLIQDIFGGQSNTLHAMLVHPVMRARIVIITNHPSVSAVAAYTMNQENKGDQP